MENEKNNRKIISIKNLLYDPIKIKRERDTMKLIYEIERKYLFNDVQFIIMNYLEHSNLDYNDRKIIRLLNKLS